MDKTTLESEFEKDSNKIFKQNVKEYTTNDKEFLSKLAELYGNALSAKGLNVVDPVYANMFHYNKLQFRGNLDLPRVSRTYVFFTRPELNFSFENINAIPFFKWLYNKRIGKMIMAMLTDPDYFINAPGALNSLSQLSYSEINDILRDYKSMTQQNEKKISSLIADSTEFKDFVANDNTTNYANLLAASISVEDLANSEENSQDDAAEVAKLQGMNINAIYDESQFEAIIAASSSINKAFEEIYGKGNSLLNRLTEFAASETKESKARDAGCLLAKEILKDAHNSPGDTFNYTTPFIPLLQNTCTQLTGTRDLQLQTHTYEQDKFSQNQSVPTGMDEIFSGGTFTTNHEDFVYGPVSLLFIVWIMYIHYVSRGWITSTREHITERILDYTCSAYVFTIGDDGRRIERFGKLTGCFPTSFPLSQQLEHNLNVEQDILQKISISWTYNKYEPMNPEIFTDFNFLSESEWLVKLKSPFWEFLYNRNGGITSEMVAEMLDPSIAKNDIEAAKLEQLGRPKELWETIEPSKRGMSGKLPRQLFEPSSDDSSINMINNYWGGYPYIVNGTDLLWVLPQYDIRQTVRRDKLESKNSSDWNSRGSVPESDKSNTKITTSNGSNNTNATTNNSDEVYNSGALMGKASDL
jgi:hypothetical protein